MSFEETISRVATKGGLTEEGVRVLKNELPKAFDEVFRRVISKRRRIIEMVNKEFN